MTHRLPNLVEPAAALPGVRSRLRLGPHPARRLRLEATVAVALAAVVGAGLYASAAARTGGRFAYPMDDAYIHMAVADTFVRAGTWGINTCEFASASSSPLWTVVLAAGFATVGRVTWLPLALNVLASIGFVGAAATLLGELGGRRRWFELALVAAAVPLPVLAGLGMEHVLHAWLTLVAIGWVGRALAGTGHLPTRALVLLAVLPMVRYEALFLCAAAAAMFAARGRLRDAGAVVVAGAALAVPFAVWSVVHGGFPVPNSLLMKSGVSTGWVANLVSSLHEGRALVAVGTSVALLFALSRGGGRLGWTRALYLGMTACHLLFAATGSFFRYEAYLLGAGAVLLVPALDLRRPLSALVAALPFVVLGARTVDAVRWFPARCLYISDVKVQVAEALREVAPGTVVAAHDIGALAWVLDTPVVDLAGLGTQEVTRLSVERRFTGPSIGAIVAEHHATLAIAVSAWMQEDRPPGWVEVGRLVWGPDPSIRGEPISIYTVGGSDPGVATEWMDGAVHRMRGAGEFVRTLRR